MANEINQRTKKNKWLYKIGQPFYILFYKGDNGKWYAEDEIYFRYLIAVQSKWYFENNLGYEAKIVKIEGEFFAN